MIRVAVVGDDVLIAKLRAAEARMVADKPQWLKTTAEIVKGSIEANIVKQGLTSEDDVHFDDKRHKPGALRRSGRIFYQTKNGVSVGYGKGLDYAAAIEFGSVEHEISARPGWELEFFWERLGVMFSEVEGVDHTRVMHPGNRPYRFFYHGVEESVYPILLNWVSYLRAVFQSPL